MRKERTRVEQTGYVEGPKDGSYYLRYWGEPDKKGKRQRKSAEIGAKGQFESRESAALSVEVALLRRRINAGVHGKTVGQVIDLFEATLTCRANTAQTAKAALAHCRLKWGDEPVAILAEPTQSKVIEGWLNSLTSRKSRSQGRPLSRDTKHQVKIRMGNIFECAMQNGYIPSTLNPMRFVRLKPTLDLPRRRQTLTVDQWQRFISDKAIPEHVKVMSKVAWFTGLRISEICGLKAADFDLDEGKLKVSRRVIRGITDAPKSKKSGESIPFPEELFVAISAWLRSPIFYRTPEGWLFASQRTGAPFDLDAIRKNYLIPWGLANGVARFGWHTFRHSYKQMLEDQGVHPAVIMRLMRHGSMPVTDKYGSGVEFSRLRGGQERVAKAKVSPIKEIQKRRWA